MLFAKDAKVTPKFFGPSSGALGGKELRSMKNVLWSLPLLLLTANMTLGAEMIFIEKELSDDQVIISRKNGEKLLLEKWSLRFSPLAFEGKVFAAEISPLWVTIYFDDRDSIKWTIEETIESAYSTPSEPSPVQTDDDLIESYISGDFEGWEGETVFILNNGQIWQQSSYSYRYHYAYRPKVIILKTGGLHKMIVDGVSDSIYVTRIK